MSHTAENSGIYKGTEFNRFGLISLVILVIGCLGGIAVGLGAIESILSLSLILIPTMIVNQKMNTMVQKMKIAILNMNMLLHPRHHFPDSKKIA